LIWRHPRAYRCEVTTMQVCTEPEHVSWPVKMTPTCPLAVTPTMRVREMIPLCFGVTSTVTGGNSSRPLAIFNIGVHLEGDVLGLDCAAIDRDGDFATAEVSILDEAELAVSPSSGFALSFGVQTHIESQLAITGLGALPTARLARVVLIDRAGNRSAAALVDLGKGEEGGLTLNSASFTGSKLILRVRGPTAKPGVGNQRARRGAAAKDQDKRIRQEADDQWRFESIGSPARRQSDSREECERLVQYSNTQHRTKFA
jgi:hypothetical protein